MNGWSKAVEIDRDTSTLKWIDPWDLDQSGTSRSYDVTSPREWLECCEAGKQENESKVDSLERESRGDPYTVLRCDYSLVSQEWRMWGMDFHLRRLEESTRLLQKEGKMAVESSPQAIDSSLETTRIMVAGILREAERTSLSIATEKAEQSIIVFMVTVLWEIEESPDSKMEITVRGHVFSTLQTTTSNSNNPNTAVKVVVGCLPSSDFPLLLPNRYEHLPQAKLSSWCRMRRPLESLFKGNDLGDVILTRGSGDDLELLEGLTSNLFVVCYGNILRTAPSTLVLGGYVRQRILDIAESCGYTLEECTLYAKDASTWEEVFLTSSIRLIVPVQEILLPTAVAKDGSLQMETLWKARKMGASEEFASEKLYRHLQQRSDK